MTKTIIHLKRPINVGMDLSLRSTRLGPQMLHQTVLGKARIFDEQNHGKNFVTVAKTFATNPNNVDNVLKAEGEGAEEINKVLSISRNKLAAGAIAATSEEMTADATPKEAIKGVQTASGRTRKTLTKGLKDDGQLDDIEETNENFTPQ